MARLLGEEKQVTLEVWRERLAGLPIAPEFPLEKRLQMRADGLIELNLNDTAVADLSPLEGMPLAVLYLGRCREVSDVRPLRGLPLKRLSLRDTGVGDLAPLGAILTLERLTLPGRTRDLTALRGLRLHFLTGLRQISCEYTPGADLRLIESTAQFWAKRARAEALRDPARGRASV